MFIDVRRFSMASFHADGLKWTVSRSKDPDARIVTAWLQLPETHFCLLNIFKLQAGAPPQPRSGLLLTGPIIHLSHFMLLIDIMHLSFNLKAHAPLEAARTRLRHWPAQLPLGAGRGAARSLLGHLQLGRVAQALWDPGTGHTTPRGGLGGSGISSSGT